MTRRRTALAIALPIITLAGTAALAGATTSAKNGRIAFVRFGLGSGGVQPSEVYVTNADGTGEQRITQPPSGYLDDLPDWSPDASRIVFQRCASGSACLIWSTEPDGTGLERRSPPCPTGTASPTCADDRSPVYSPDGRHIAFVRTKRKAVLMVAGGKLGRARPVGLLGSSRGSPYAVGWSPNGRQLVFAAVNDTASKARPVDGRALYVVGVDGKGVRRLTPWSLNAGGRPSWSPDGKRILFRSESNRLGGFGANLYAVRPDGSGLIQVTHAQSSDRVLGGSYSPDGRSIVVATSAGATGPAPGQPDIFVMRTDGSHAVPVTRSANWEASPDWGPAR